jgi:hypothetical protein
MQVRLTSPDERQESQSRHPHRRFQQCAQPGTRQPFNGGNEGRTDDRILFPAVRELRDGDCILEVFVSIGFRDLGCSVSTRRG